MRLRSDKNEIKNKLDNPSETQSSKPKSTKCIQKAEDVGIANTSTRTQNENEGKCSTIDDAVEGEGDNSECSNGDSNISSLTPQREHQSPTVATTVTSGSGTSESVSESESTPSQSGANTRTTTTQRQRQSSSNRNNDRNNSKYVDTHRAAATGTATATDDGTKASWESGNSNVSPSSFITVKLLVSNNMAGSIIGRAGETISELQEQSSARIKLGQSGDYYPGTSERACLMHGTLENVKKAVTLVLQKLYDLQLQQVEAQLGRHAPRQKSKGLKSNDDDDDDDDTSTTDSVTATTCIAKDKNVTDGAGTSKKDDSKDDNSSSTTTTATTISFSVRLLIPAASCGMMIGRNGLNIKKMKETSRVSSIRLTSKEPDHSNSNMHFSSESMAISATLERILSITGNELNACISCAFLILEGFARHQDICRYANSTTSYSKVTSSFHSHYTPNQLGYAIRPSTSAGGGGISTLSQPRGGNRTASAYLPSHHSQNIQQRIQRPGRFNPERSTNSSSGGVLMHGSTSNERRSQQQQQQHHQSQIYRNGSLVGAQLGSQVAPHLQPTPMYGRNASRHSQNALPSPPPELQQQMHTVKISVSDTMVGAILGKRGQTLNELENQSGTKIKISQRGEFVPGTNNRIVTISAPSNENIASAKSLIRQQLARNSLGRWA